MGRATLKKLQLLSFVLFLTMSTDKANADSDLWTNNEALMRQRSDGLVLEKWETYGYPEYPRGWVLLRTGLKAIPTGLPYPMNSVLFFRTNNMALVFKQEGGYPLRPDWRLVAHDPISWIFGQLKGVCEVEQFTNYQLKIFEPVCYFNTRMN